MPPFNVGIRLKNDKLYSFGKYRLVVVRGWPEMAAWTKSSRAKSWQRVRPEMDLRSNYVSCELPKHRSLIPVGIGPAERAARERRIAELEQPDGPDVQDPEASDRKDRLRYLRRKLAEDRQTVGLYFSNIPNDVRTIVERIPGRQWHVLAAAARCPAYRDLLQSNAALAMCLASCWCFDGLPSAYAIRRIRSYVQRRRRDVCDRLGLGGTESTVRLLGRFQPESCTISSVRNISALLAEPVWRNTLRHLPNVNPTVALILANQATVRLVAPSFISRLAEEEEEQAADHRCRILLDAVRMQRVLQRDPQVEVTAPIRSWSKAQDIHDDLVQHMHLNRQAELPENFEGDFPPPPVIGMPGIRPLETASELSQEAEEMNHCAFAFAPDVVSGSAYFYRIDLPERCTLCIRRERHGWEIQEVRGYGNAEVQGATFSALAAWLSGTD